MEKTHFTLRREFRVSECVSAIALSEGLVALACRSITKSGTDRITLTRLSDGKKICLPNDNPLDHAGRIIGLRFYDLDHSPRGLISWSRDAVLDWSIHVDGEEMEFSARALPFESEHLGDVEFNQDNSLMSCSVEKTVIVMHLGTGRKLRLVGHSRRVTKTAFSNAHHTLLISASEDRTFKVWDLAAEVCVFQSSIISAFAISTIVLHPLGNLLVAGTEDGTLYVFDIFFDSRPAHATERRRVDLGRLAPRPSKGSGIDVSVDKTVFCASPYSIAPSRQTDDSSEVRMSAAGLAMSFINAEADNILLVVVKSGLMLFNLLTLDVLSTFLFDEAISIVEIFNVPVLASTELLVADKIGNYCSLMILEKDSHQRFSRRLGQSSISVIYEDCAKQITQMTVDEKTSPSLISLRSIDSAKESKGSLPRKTVAKMPLSKPKKPAMTLNQPTTFKKTVRSSGYLSGPICSKLHSPFTNPAERDRKAKHPSFTRSTTSAWADTDNASFAISNSTFIVAPAPIVSVGYSVSGGHFATASTDKALRIYKQKRNGVENVSVYRGHSSSLLNISWSANLYDDVDRILTSTTDGSGYMWSLTSLDPLLRIEGRRDAGGRVPVRDRYNELTFFQRDSFILASTTRELHLLKYKIEQIDLNSVKPGVNFNSYAIKMARTFDNSISAICGANAFSSTIAIICTAPTLSLFDVQRQSIVCEFPNAHSRAIHAVAVADQEQEHTSGCQSIFITSAVTDGIRVWDVRVPDRSINRLASHLNRHAALKCCLSPCGRYVSTGSEDKHAYIYDLRKGAAAFEKLAVGQTDVVMCTSFHPYKRELVAAGQSGRATVLVA